MLEELSKLKYKIESLKNNLTYINNEIPQLEKDIEVLNTDYSHIIEASQFYKKALDVIYENSVGEIRDLVNSGLQCAYPDRDFRFDIEINDKRGKSMKFLFYENEMPVDLIDGCGKGVQAVVSAILQLYYLQCKGIDTLLLDEAYSNLDEYATKPFFEFLEKLCAGLNFRMVLITHDKRFMDYGVKTYVFDKGKVTEYETKK